MPPPRGSGSRPLDELELGPDQARASVIPVLKAIPDPLVLVGDDRRIAYANPAMEDAFGYDLGDMLERPVEDLVASEDERSCLHAFAELLRAQQGGPDRRTLSKVTAVPRSGDGFPATVKLRPLDLGDARLVLATIHDHRDEPVAEAQVDDLEAAREQIHYQKTLLESQNEASIDGILIVDQNSRIVSYNQRFLDLWGVEEELIEVGRTDEEALGSVLDEIVDVDAFLEKVEYLHENPGETIRDEVHLEDGTVLERWSTPVVSEEGDYYGRGWYFRDITDRKRVEAELRRHREELEDRVEARTRELKATAEQLREEVEQRKQAEQELEQQVWELARANADLERFAYVASHDLQEPLRMIASYVQLLERQYGDALGEDAKEYIDYAVEGATRLQSQIRDLLDYSQVGSEGRTRQPVPLDRVVDRALDHLEDLLESSGAIVDREQLPTVSGVAPQLVQVFEALIGNAIKFHEPGETPHVRIHAQHAGEEAWRITVEDDGIGIEESYHDRIFLLFERLNARERYPGTGIGLALCKKVVENHNGEIWVESEPGQGTRVHLTLPATDDAPAPA